MHLSIRNMWKQSSKYAAHDETNLFRVGDLVEIEECRPISKQ